MSSYLFCEIGNQQALRNALFRTGVNTSRAAQTALAPIELLNPRNLLQYWANYGDFVAQRQKKRKNGKRRFDEAENLIPELSDEYFDEVENQ